MSCFEANVLEFASGGTWKPTNEADKTTINNREGTLTYNVKLPSGLIVLKCNFVVYIQIKFADIRIVAEAA
jgi:hypothetical protein